MPAALDPTDRLPATCQPTHHARSSGQRYRDLQRVITRGGYPKREVRLLTLEPVEGSTPARRLEVVRWLPEHPDLRPAAHLVLPEYRGVVWEVLAVGSRRLRRGDGNFRSYYGQPPAGSGWTQRRQQQRVVATAEADYAASGPELAPAMPAALPPPNLSGSPTDPPPAVSVGLTQPFPGA